MHKIKSFVKKLDNKRLEKIVLYFEKTPSNYLHWIILFFFIISLRLFIEHSLSDFQNFSLFFIFHEASQLFFFFSMAYLLTFVLIDKITRIKTKSVLNILSWGMVLILFPPFIDLIISGGQGFWSFFLFDSLPELAIRFVTFFGENPEKGITYGTRIIALLSILFLTFYIYFKTKSIKKVLLVDVGLYSIYFFLSCLPSLVTILIKGFSKGFLKVSEIDVAQKFLSPLKIFSQEIDNIYTVLAIRMNLVDSFLFIVIIIAILYIYQKNKLIAFGKNIRLPQIIYHGGLFTMGAALGLILWSKKIYLDFFDFLSFFLGLISVFCAWITSVVINDFFDQKIDEKTNTERPLVKTKNNKKQFNEKEYLLWGVVLFMASLWFSAIVDFRIMLFILAYQALAWIYSAWPLRLKRIPGIASFISAVASLLIILAGFLLTDKDNSIANFPTQIIWLLLFSYTFSLPLKDFKDIEGDKQEKIITLPVFLGEYWAKIVIAGGIFFSYILSVVLINEPDLFIWAAVFGSLSFWVVIKMHSENSNQHKKKNKNNWINYKNIFWWILMLVFIYGLILVNIALN